jgi:hypothetical protein
MKNDQWVKINDWLWRCALVTSAETIPSNRSAQEWILCWQFLKECPCQWIEQTLEDFYVYMDPYVNRELLDLAITAPLQTEEEARMFARAKAEIERN